jgi:hypothetical protein
MHNTAHLQANQVLMTIWNSQKKESGWQVRIRMQVQELQCLHWMEWQVRLCYPQACLAELPPRFLSEGTRENMPQWKEDENSFFSFLFYILKQ